MRRRAGGILRTFLFFFKFVTKRGLDRLTYEIGKGVMIIMDFEKLYEAYYMQVYSYVMTLAGNRDLAEEITQNAFFKALSSQKSYRGTAGVLTWICSIAKNLYMDEMRRKRHIAPQEGKTEIEAGENMERDILRADSAYQIHCILHRLEEPYKEVFQLRVFGELSFQKIASIFGKTENWARVTYHRARLKISERMEKE